MIDPLSIIAYRREHKLSQRQLADHLGVSLRTVGNWEAGRVTPQPAVRAQLAEMLGSQLWDVTEDSVAEFTPSPLEERIAGTIRAEAARLMKTQQELADAAGMSQPQMSKVMRAERPMTLGMLEALADVLDLELRLDITPRLAPALHPVPDWAERRQQLRDEGEMGYE